MDDCNLKMLMVPNCELFWQLAFYKGIVVAVASFQIRGKSSDIHEIVSETFEISSSGGSSKDK